MNPFPQYQFTQPRDKTKSYFQPASHNPFSGSQSSAISHNNSSAALQSDKYKSYYTEYQDYRHSSVSEIDHQYSAKININSNNGNEVQPRSSKYAQDNGRFSNSNTANGFYIASNNNNPQFQRQKSHQRNRFYTLTEQERSHFDHTNHPLANIHEDNFSQSMIVTTNRPPSTSKEQGTTKKDFYKFQGTGKFSSSRVESQYNSRQKKTDSNSHNKTDYLQKANKKVSLKRDIAPISPNYQQHSTNSNNNPPPKYPHANSSFVNISNKFNQNSNNKNGNESTTSFAQNLSEVYQKQVNLNSHKILNEDMILPSTLERFSSSLQNSELSVNNKNSQNEAKQVSFKKRLSKGGVTTYEIQRATSVYDLERATPSSQSSSTAGNNLFVSGGNNNNNSNNNDNINNENSTTTATKQYFGSIRSNTPNQKQPSTQQLIDSQVFTDMKISRIQQSTLNLQQKLTTLTKTLQQLLHQSKQHQTSITQINNYITKQQEQGLTPHDIKRIKKQLKIMKNNFQTAFTSMTEQINRKLIKEETIMKSLSDEIRLVAQDNQKLTQTIEKRSRKVDSIQKSMTSFMRQNEQRMENIVLSQSFSSSKRSKNHSFEYGLDLKNMSSDDNYNTGKSMGIDNSSIKKIESIEKQISKMKVFHIKEQQIYQVKFAELKKEIQKVGSEKQKYIVRTDAQEMIREAVDQLLLLKLQNWQISQTQQQEEKQQKLKEQLQTIKHKIQELSKICHEQLYDYRMNKLQQQPVAPKFVTESKIKTMNSEFEQQLTQLQGKQRSMLVTLTEFQQKLISFEDRQHMLGKNFDDLRLKELKHVGDIRELQSLNKQVNSVLNKMSGFRVSTQNTMNQLSQLTNAQKGLINSLQTKSTNLQTRINEVDRINSIQTENIQSINNEFERVINKEIIPKIQQVHSATIEINHKIFGLSTDVTFVRKVTQSLGAFNTTHGESFTINGAKQLTDSTELQKKVQQFFTQNISKFINSKVKLISTKFISSKSPLSKIGLFKDKKLNQETQNFFKKNNSYNNNNSYENDLSQIGKEEVYLIDEDGFLMDWEGAYLMEVDEFGSRKKIKLSEEEIYFMEVNGLQIKKPSTVLN